MQSKPKEQVPAKQSLLPYFPLQYNKEQSIYVLLENSFASNLVQLHIGNKVPQPMIRDFSWYLHPEEALYLISVCQLNETKEQNSRQKLIRRVYKNALIEDIDAMQFYLTIRKRNKFLRRIDRYSLLQLKNTEENILKQVKKYRLFKLYELSEDHNEDKNYKYCLLTATDQTISSCLFSSFIEKVKQLLSIETLLVCIFENNDFIFIQMRDV